MGFSDLQHEDSRRHEPTEESVGLERRVRAPAGVDRSAAQPASIIYSTADCDLLPHQNMLWSGVTL